MFQTLLQIQTPFRLQFSFGHIIDELEKQAADKSDPGSGSAALLLQELSVFPELKEGITDISVLQNNKDLLRKLLVNYFPPALTNNEIKAVGIPFMRELFNLTNRFQKILLAAGPDFDISIRNFTEHQFYVLNCCLILLDVYGINFDFSRPLFYDIPTANGIIKHYRILYNADFMEILPTEKSKVLTPEEIDILRDNYDDLALWKEKFPADSWLLKGFALITLVDATVENAVSIFKEKLLTFNSPDFKESVSSIFRSIYQIPDIRIGFTLFNPEEEKFSITGLAQQMPSFILPDDQEKKASEALCYTSYQKLVIAKNYFAVSDIAKFKAEKPDSELARHFLAQNIQSFILAPVIKNNVLLGILEIVSPRVKELNSINANKLDVVMPFLTDKMERLGVELQNQIQAFIQDTFTTIHPSVNWKFRDEAKKYIAGKQIGQETPLKDIVFADVYPLYGQIDVKGSSEARNISVQQDLEQQLLTLCTLLTQLQDQYGLTTLEQELKEVEKFIKQLSGPLQANTEQHITTYLHTRIYRHLHQLNQPEIQPLLLSYFKEEDKLTGSFHIFRRKYEKTISKINAKLTGILDSRQADAQAYFPHYYERFKTDGVEHNLYVGASIAPNHSFSLLKLHQLRYWQLRVLCDMEIAHYQLAPTLPYPLAVTSLILVYSTPIAIRFRMDEKRFDVDGSYNARFEILKKRIDKAHIKNTHERITTAGKITIVYSSDAEQKEYLGYLQQLQTENILTPDVETLEVEELQGVAGLKALRATLIHRE